jgi:hypothetical protein
VRAALAHEQAALVLLQRAFARARYILRALTQRVRLDLSRRLTGTLAGLTLASRSATDAEIPAATADLRLILADLAALAIASGAGADRALSSLAQRTLRVDPSSEEIQQVAARIERAARVMGSPGAAVPEARSARDSAAIALARLIRGKLPGMPASERSTSAAILSGSLADALRAAGARGR